MIYKFLSNMQCVRQDENADYQDILDSWKSKENHIAFMPAISWYGGIFNLFDQKAGMNGRNMIWLIPAGQANYYFLENNLRQMVSMFYDKDEIEFTQSSEFPGIEVEEFEECVLLHSNNLQTDPEHSILGANVILIRLSLSSGRDTLLFILLDHQDHCWKKVIEDYDIRLDWFVDSGRGTEDYYTRTRLYQLMKFTPKPEVLPSLYFKGLYNKGEVPENFQFRYALLSKPDHDGYDKWKTFSAVFETGWNS